ncbi:hypothetical protein PIB30_003512 [Stylosanthes scabra]|uniref:DUF4283 domain-containing protein n=1 Tax=Stylosanthes scabra TaxID=79078 RepID=A0ABU6W3B6_9FABA|nr:hypothetical protein [Stylosanthes scabra]
MGSENEKPDTIMTDKGETKDQPIHEVVKGEVNVELVEMLKRSLIGESALPLNREDIIPRLYKEWETLREVKEMGPFKMVLTFRSVEDKDKARLSPLLLTYFGEIRNWTEQEANSTRKAKVEIYGMPIQAWKIPEERKYKCKIDDDVMLMKEAGDSKISGSNEEVAGNCEKSNSTRCIVDDRRSEDLIKETQMALSLGQNMKGPIQYNLEVEGLEVEPSSNPQFPPGFEDFNTEKTELNQQHEVQSSEESMQGSPKYAPEKKGESRS